MDPIATGFALGSVVVAPLAKQLTDPETVTKGIHWVLAAADHFLKVKRGEVHPDEPAPLPPNPEVVDEKVQTPSPLRVKPDIDAFKLKLWADQVESLMEQIEIYVGNLKLLLKQAALHGGEDKVPIALANDIKLQRRSIAEGLNELAGLMNQIYGVQIKEVDKLAEILNVI